MQTQAPRAVVPTPSRENWKTLMAFVARDYVILRGVSRVGGVYQWVDWYSVRGGLNFALEAT